MGNDRAVLAVSTEQEGSPEGGASRAAQHVSNLADHLVRLTGRSDGKVTPQTTPDKQ